MPRLSVIIPIYEVEPYLAACLESVAAQTWRDLEAVMVDDGSRDSSALIAAAFAERDPRFRLISQENAGLGAARNTGVRHATGEFLAFLDSDDLLPVHALEYLLAALSDTGSDLATGNVLRFDGRRARPSALHRAVFARPATATHVTRENALLRDRLVTNKLWRRTFWEAGGFGFPEGVLYEDIAVALRGHFLARSVDVMPAPVYLWRVRDGGSRSITQDKTRLGHLEDRFAAVRTVRTFLSEHGMRAQIHAWDRTVLETDLTNFVDVLDQAGGAFHDRFLELANDYLDDVAAPVLDGLPALRRLQWHLIRQRRLADLLDVLAWDRRVPPDERFTRRMWAYHLDIPLLREREPKVPAAVSRVRDELAPRTRVDAIRWQDGRLVVEGRAAPDCPRPVRRYHQQIFASLVHERTRRRIRVPATVVRTRVSAKSGSRRDWGGFRLVIDPGALGRRPGLWHVELRMIHRGLPLRRVRLADPRAVWADRVGQRSVGPDLYVAPLLTETGDLALRAEREIARIVTQSVRDGRLRLVGRAVRGLGPAPSLLVTRQPGGVPLSCPIEVDGCTFETEVDLRDVIGRGRLGNVGGLAGGLGNARPGVETPGEEPAVWRVEVLTADGIVTPVTAADDLSIGRYGTAGREIVVLPDPSGRLILRDQPVAAFADLSEWLPGGELLIEGGFAVPCGPAALVVRSLDRDDVRLARIEGAGSRFRARLVPEEVDSAAGWLPLPRGRYGLAIRVRDGEGDGGLSRDLPIELDADEPLVHETARRTFELAADGEGHAVLTVGSDLSANERGKKAQRELRTKAYPAMRARPLRPAVLFSGHGGRRFAGSPRAIYEELRRRGVELSFLCEVRDGQVALPDSVEPVRSRGREHYEALARCRYVITDHDLPRWFERRTDQTVVQTWHGPPAALAAPEEGRRPVHGAGQWTHVLSPGPWWTPRLRETFGFTGFAGQVLETGLPCDDVLVGPDVLIGADVLTDPEGAAGADRGAAAVAEAKRFARQLARQLARRRLFGRLGTPEDTRLILYVPPDRSSLHDRDGRGDRGGVPLDLERVRAALGDGHLLLDLCVSTHPDPHELYLAADLLVTGHAGAMFDFAVTGRPMLFHVEANASGNGIEDLRPEVPGPVLRTPDEVIEAIHEIDEIAEKYASALEAFVARFRPLADGAASRRVVDLLLG